MTGTGPFLFEAFKFMVLQWVLRKLPRDWFSLICGFWGEINSSITFHQSHFLQGSILTAVRGFEPGMAGWNVWSLPLCFVIPFNKLNKTLFCRFSREDFSLVTHSLNFRSNGVANLDIRAPRRLVLLAPTSANCFSIHWEWSSLFFTRIITTLAQLPRLYVNQWSGSVVDNSLQLRSKIILALKNMKEWSKRETGILDSTVKPSLVRQRKQILCHCCSF